MNSIRFLRDDNGAVLVEVTVMMAIMFVFILGSIEFLFAFYQWNAAAKAVQVGARIAAVSNPVPTGLTSLSTAVVGRLSSPGGAMPDFIVTCDGSAASCTCSTVLVCPGGLAYDADAMNTIVFGRGSSSCSDATSSYDAGMCDIFPRITAANVMLVYAQTGLGFAGRPGGPVPTITLSLQHLPLQFLFMKGILGFPSIEIPALTTSITGEDLSTAAPVY